MQLLWFCGSVRQAAIPPEGPSVPPVRSALAGRAAEQEPERQRQAAAAGERSTQLYLNSLFGPVLKNPCLQIRPGCIPDTRTSLLRRSRPLPVAQTPFRLSRFTQVTVRTLRPAGQTLNLVLVLIKWTTYSSSPSGPAGSRHLQGPGGSSAGLQGS